MIGMRHAADTRLHVLHPDEVGADGASKLHAVAGGKRAVGGGQAGQLRRKLRQQGIGRVIVGEAASRQNDCICM